MNINTLFIVIATIGLVMILYLVNMNCISRLNSIAGQLNTIQLQTVERYEPPPQEIKVNIKLKEKSK